MSKDIVKNKRAIRIAENNPYPCRPMTAIQRYAASNCIELLKDGFLDKDIYESSKELQIHFNGLPKSTRERYEVSAKESFEIFARKLTKKLPSDKKLAFTNVTDIEPTLVEKETKKVKRDKHKPNKPSSVYVRWMNMNPDNIDYDKRAGVAARNKALSPAWKKYKKDALRVKKKAKVIEKLQNEYYNDMKLYVTAMIKYYLEKKAQSALDEAQYRAYKSFTKTYGKQGELFEQVYQKTLDKKDPSYVKPPRVKKAKAPSKKNTKENEQCDDDNTENVTQDDISDKEDANNSDEDVFQDI